MENFFKTTEQGLSLRKEGLFPKDLDSFQTQKREYFAIREILFGSALLQASAAVERTTTADLNQMLLKTSLSLMAATDLVRNFHVLAASVSNHPALREIWNEGDTEHGIPKNSWDISLEAYRNSQYHDLFREAIERLTRHRDQLESNLNRGDRAFLALYRQGIDPPLREAEQRYLLLVARFAEEDLSQDEQQIRRLVEQSRALRREWTASAPLLSQAIARDGGLIRGSVHVRVHAAKREYLDLREALYHLAFKHVPKLTREDIPYPRQFRLRAIGISLLAAVTLYENSHSLQTSLLTIPAVKSLLNQGDTSLGISPGFWDNIYTEFTRLGYRRLLLAGTEAMEKERDSRPDSTIEADAFLAFVATEIATSTAIPEIRNEGILPKIARGLQNYSKLIQKMGFGVLGIAKIPLSSGLGSLGSIELRKGKLFDQPQWVQFVRERLQPGDLLLEKSPFRLSNKFIPGHFGHVALYVGTKAELEALGLLEHPWVVKYLKEVGEGNTIVEALPSGTRISPIEQFLNTDDLAIIRPKNDKISHADVVKAIALAFSHVGKQYDFSFDSNTWDTIVCSELAFHTYVNVRWPFLKILGSYTIAPDDVAVFAGSDPARPFEVISFIHDGQLVHDQPTGLYSEQKYVDLLGQRYADAGLYAGGR